MSTDSTLPVTPAGHRLLVEIIKMEKTTKGGIIIADSIAERRDQAADKGVIRAIGPNCWLAFDEGKAWASVGDTVMLKRYVGTVFDHNDRKYTLINDEEVLAIVNKDIDAADIAL